MSHTRLFIFYQASHLETETISYEEKEQQLVNDCVKELRKKRQNFHYIHTLLIKSGPFGQILILSVIPGNSNLQITSLSEELARKSDDASRQQEEITHLLSQIVDLQKKVKMV